MRKIHLVLFIIISFFLFGCIEQTVKSTAPSVTSKMIAHQFKNPTNRPEFLFVQTAASGRLTRVDKSEKLYHLVLKNVDPVVSYFSNRPNRIVGVMSEQQFLNVWWKSRHEFAVNPPNVSVTALSVKLTRGLKSENFLLALTNPRYDEKNHTVTYDVYPVNKHVTLPLKKAFFHVTLFIDDFCTTCIS